MKTIYYTTLIFLFSVSLTQSASANRCNPPSAKELARSQSFLANTPCAPVVAACNAGGYVLNCHKINGKGLEFDCLHPLKNGQPVAGVSMQPSDSNVASCKAYCKSNHGQCKEEKGVADR